MYLAASDYACTLEFFRAYWKSVHLGIERPEPTCKALLYRPYIPPGSSITACSRAQKDRQKIAPQALRESVLRQSVYTGRSAEAASLPAARTLDSLHQYRKIPAKPDYTE